ncbi:hypothetical protein CCR75_007613 [Bremia lactucae]|uniref:Uncharacterized protein n=1 Tax=Bremia lactucae TaxID=4779 RepID=A0A976ILU6_BRELC|nr:hypothetical protein CCR75_007613 [Bremia lactucae]
MAHQKAERTETEAQAFCTRALKGQRRETTLRLYLCVDHDKVDAIMHKLCETQQSVSGLVKASARGKYDEVVNLVAAIVRDSR